MLSGKSQKIDPLFILATISKILIKMNTEKLVQSILEAFETLNQIQLYPNTYSKIFE